MFFLPLLIASGGNAGAQSATLMIRSLASGQVILRNWLRLVGREVLVSFLLGVTMAAAVSLIAVLRAPEIIVVVCATMTITVMVGSLVGTPALYIHQTQTRPGNRQRPPDHLYRGYLRGDHLLLHRCLVP